ncbi:uncharacterized protein TM35_000151440 [Trypanosoma theileri]|uniref:Uncharacterized protein n=1 Tax=Trypanosoma theileri TaxID=67003 RepID=A0A1X0NW50_9TRYP|nr:uncharacterized protein TM35_000151440 [Trypanosoma theileri]ORC88713.1 hypothetical protein TM35_000151440 [Trypanosoma theileri]
MNETAVKSSTTPTTTNTTTTTNNNNNNNSNSDNNTTTSTITIASIKNELDAAVKTFEQHIRRAVVKVDKYLRKGAPADTTSVETKLEDFKQSVVLFNSGCKSILLVAKQTIQKLDQCGSNPNADNNTVLQLQKDQQELQQLKEELQQIQEERQLQKEKQEMAEALAAKSNALLEETEALVTEKENKMMELQKHVEELQQTLETVKKEHEQQQRETIAELKEKKEAWAQLNIEKESHQEELDTAQTQIQYLEERLSTLEKSRTREFALLERMSRDHERDITVWQSKCTQALQELERVQAEKKEMISRFVDENLRAQVQDLQRECNRLREVNAELRCESINMKSTVIKENEEKEKENGNGDVIVSSLDPVMSISVVNKKKKMIVNPAIVSLSAEKKELSDQLSAVFEEKLSIEKELFLLRQRLAFMEQHHCKCATLQITSSFPIKEEEKDGKRGVIDGIKREISMEIHNNNNNNNNNNIVGIPPVPIKKCDVAIQYDTPNNNVNNNNNNNNNNNDGIHSHQSNERVLELEACVRRLEEQLIDVVTTATTAIEEERLAASHQYQQELSIHEGIYQSKLNAIRTEAAQHAREAQQTLESHYKNQLQHANECIRTREDRALLAEKKVLAMQIDNEQLRVRVKVLERALEDMQQTQVKPISQHVVIPTVQSSARDLNHSERNSHLDKRRMSQQQQQEEKEKEEEEEQDLLRVHSVVSCSRSSGGTSVKSRVEVLTRLDDVIKQVHERLTALDNEVAGITEAYEMEYWERMRGVEHLRALLTTGDNNNNNNNNNNHKDEDNDNDNSDSAAASVSALLEAQRVARRDITLYYKAAEEKREELVGVLEKAINRRLKLIQE